MKLYFKYVLPVFIIIVLSNCRSGREVSYNMYEGLRPEDETTLLASLENGKILYKKNCSDCHGIFSKGKNDITNFSNEELHDYKSSFLAEDEDNHAVMNHLSEEELSNILLFLRMVKRDE